MFPTRPYKSGINLSILGFGGIVVCGLEQRDADHRVAHAIDLGINYFDCAPLYSGGEAEIKLGHSLKPFRKQIFLAEKSMCRDAAGAQADLETTLKRFHTDYLDLYQFHAVASMDDVDQILAPGGAAETVLKAKQNGTVRFVGFSAHHAPAAIRLMDALALDSILFPVNLNAWKNGGFGPQILEKAKSKNMARLALKALAFGLCSDHKPSKKYPKCWYEPIDDRHLAQLALRFTLNQDITAAVPPGDERIFDMALELAAHPLPPLTPSETEELSTHLSVLEPVFECAS